MNSRERIIEMIFPAAALVSAAATLSIPLIMAISGLPLFTGGNFLQYVTGQWSPLNGEYGIIPMIAGSVSIALLSLGIGFPVCLGYTALMTVYAPRRIRSFLRRIIFVMSGIPTVIYGFAGIFLLVPLVRAVNSEGSGLSVLTAAFLLALLTAPTMILMVHTSFMNIPGKYLLAIEASGGTQTDLLLYGYLRYSGKGILAGLLLGFGRAASDTLIALMVAGNAVTIPSSIFDSARTLTSHIALVFAADFESGEFRSIYTCGLTLYLITTTIALLVRSMSPADPGATR